MNVGYLRYPDLSNSIFQFDFQSRDLTFGACAMIRFAKKCDHAGRTATKRATRKRVQVGEGEAASCLQVDK